VCFGFLKLTSYSKLRNPKLYLKKTSQKILKNVSNIRNFGQEQERNLQCIFFYSFWGAGEERACEERAGEERVGEECSSVECSGEECSGENNSGDSGENFGDKISGEENSGEENFTKKNYG
jgi:hypothetical protein